MKPITPIIFALLLASMHSHASDQLLTINPMIKYKEAGGDCGCYFYMQEKPENEGFILYWGFRDKHAAMKINGKLTKLDIVEQNISYKLGQDTTFKLKSGLISANGSCKVAGVCPPESESCEITDYRGTLVVSNSSQEKRVPIKGVCGC